MKLRELFKPTVTILNNFYQQTVQWTYDVIYDAAITLHSAPTIQEIDYTDKNYWAAMLADEFERIEEELEAITSLQLKDQLKAMLALIGKHKASPKNYADG